MLSDHNVGTRADAARTMLVSNNIAESQITPLSRCRRPAFSESKTLFELV